MTRVALASTLAVPLALGALLHALPAAAAADDGGQMYGKKCLACHGLDGAGDKPLGKKVGAPDLRKTTMSQADIERIIADGKGKMLPYKDRLTPEQIAAIAAHVKSALTLPRPPEPPSDQRPASKP